MLMCSRHVCSVLYLSEMVCCLRYYSARDTARDARFTVVPLGYTGYMYCVSARACAGRRKRFTGEVSTMRPLWSALSELAYSVRWVGPSMLHLATGCRCRCCICGSWAARGFSAPMWARMYTCCREKPARAVSNSSQGVESRELGAILR